MANKIDKQTLILYLSLFLLISAQIFYIAGSLLANLSIIFFILGYFILEKINNQFVFIKKYRIQIFLIFIYILINIFSSEYKFISSSKFIFYVRFILFTFALVFFLKIIQNKIGLYSKLLFLLILFLIIDSFIQFYFGKDIFGFEYNDQYFRTSGPFGDEWIIGSYLLYIGFLSLSYLNNFFKINDKYNLLLFLIISLTILFSGERSSFISIFYFLILMLIFSNKKKFIFLLSCLLIVASLFSINFSKNLTYKYNLLNLPPSTKISDVIIGIELPIISKNHKINKNSNKLESKNLKKNFLEEFVDKAKNSKWIGHSYRAFQIFKDNVFFGSGFRTYRYHCYKYDNNIDKKITKCSTHPHNFHSEIISDNGLFGYLIFFIFILNILYFFIKNKFYKDFSVTIIFCLIITFIFPLKTTGSFFTTNSSFIFWVLIGHYFHLKSLKEKINS